MSYLPVRQWWLRPFRRFGRCQDKDIFQQWKSGVRYFDLRVRFNERGSAVFAHGLLEYRSEMSPEEVIRWLGKKAVECGEKVYVRVLLETVCEADKYQTDCFDEFQKRVICDGSIYFMMGRKSPFEIWHSDFDRPFIEVAEWINTLWKFLRTPRWYALGIQAVRLSALDSAYDGIVSMDFV